MTLFWFYPSTVFSTFDIDQLGKIRHLEELWGSLKLVILPSFKVKCLKRAKLDIAPKNLRTSHLHPTTIQRFVNFHNFADPYISSLVFDKSLSNLTVLLILRRSYQRGRRIFPNLSMSKVKKKKKTVERSIVINCSFLFSQKTIKIKQFIYPTTRRRRLDNSVSVKYTGQASQYFLHNNNTNTSVSRAFRLLDFPFPFPFQV